MKEIVFNSQEELYQRIKPALRSKKKMIVSEGYKRITEKDIWDYMRYNKWSDSYGLELCDMVDDILHTDTQQIINYCHSIYMPVSEKKLEDYDLPKLRS